MLETDYLIIGSGALGMTFGDQMLTDSDATLMFVDKHHMPGGHWNDAYSFVRLHQPSAFYGVGSQELGSNRLDETGINKGYYELASAPELRTYFDRLMRERFLPSGRVRYFPLSEYLGDGVFRSLVSGKQQTVKVNKKIVDASYFNTSVPSTRPPPYEIASGVEVIPPNDLPNKVAQHSRYTVVGGGKTGMDVGVWLLQNGAMPEQIRWIVPRDSWLINRETTQPGDLFANRFLDAKAAQLESCANASSVDHLFDLLEESGVLLRLDKTIRPQMYHGATIAQGEIDALATIGEIIRMGRVSKIEPDKIVLAEGKVQARADDLYIDCTASAIARRPSRPVFEDDTITVQMIRAGLFCFSAAVIAHLETSAASDAEKNALCPPMQAPDGISDWLVLMKQENEIARLWAPQKELRHWVGQHRLSGANLRSKETKPDAENMAIRERIAAVSSAADAKLKQLLDGVV